MLYEALMQYNQLNLYKNMISGRHISGMASAMGRQARNVFITPGVEVFTSIFNAGLPQPRIEPINEENRLHIAYFVQPLAWPSLALCGATSAFAISICDSVQSGLGIAVTLNNAGLHKDDFFYIEGEDTRKPWRQMGPQAWPGIALGVVAGVIDLIIHDSIRSGLNAYASICNQGMPENLHFQYFNSFDKDSREPWRQYCIQAWPGILVGGTLGILATSVEDMLRAATTTFTSLYNAGLLSKNDQIERVTSFKDDNRSPFRKVLPPAWVGMLAGGIAGLVTIAIVDSFKSGTGAFITMVTAARLGYGTLREKVTDARCCPCRLEHTATVSLVWW